MKTPASFLLLVLAMAGTITASDSIAVASGEQLSWKGYVRSSAFGGSDAYQLNNLFAEIALQGEWRKGNAFLQTDVRLRKGSFFGADEQGIEVKNMTVGYRTRKIDLLIGYQDIAWGRCDGFNPTNYLQSSDYFFLTAQPSDQFRSNMALRTRFRMNAFTELDIVLQPFYLPSVYRYELFDLGTNVRFAEPLFPARNIENGSLAARLNFELPAFGASLSAFRGYDPYHGFTVSGIDWTSGAPVITNQAASYRKTSLGGDLAVPFGNILLKAEMAWNNSGPITNEMHIPADYWMYVAGVEAGLGSTTLLLQYIGFLTPGFQALALPVLSNPLNPLEQMAYANAMIDYENRQFNRRIFHQQEKTNHAASLTLANRWGYDTWKTDITAYYDFTSDEWLLRAALNWAISDQLALAAGGQYLKGKTGSLFGYSSSVLSGAFLELKVNF